jgi:hypothetical protein
VDAASLDQRRTAVVRGGRATHTLVREGRRVRLVRRLFHERTADRDAPGRQRA